MRDGVGNSPRQVLDSDLIAGGTPHSRMPSAAVIHSIMLPASGKQWPAYTCLASVMLQCVSGEDLSLVQTGFNQGYQRPVSEGPSTKSAAYPAWISPQPISSIRAVRSYHSEAFWHGSDNCKRTKSSHQLLVRSTMSQDSLMSRSSAFTIA